MRVALLAALLVVAAAAGDVSPLLGEEDAAGGCLPCQMLSHKYGISHGGSWGSADEYAKSCWIEKACKTMADAPPVAASTRAAHLSSEPEWEREAHQQLDKEMRAEVQDVQGQIEGQRQFTKTMAGPLQRLGKEEHKLNGEESESLEQATFIEKQLAHVENEVNDRVVASAKATDLGESNEKSGAIDKVKTAYLAGLKDDVQQVKHREEAKMAKMDGKLRAAKLHAHANKETLSKEFALEQSEASALEDLSHAASIESKTGTPIMKLARRVAADSKSTAGRLQAAVERRAAPLLGEPKTEIHTAAVETALQRNLRLRKAELAQVKNMQGEAVELASRVHDQALQTEARQHLADHAFGRVHEEVNAVAHHMLARADISPQQRQTDLGEGQPALGPAAKAVLAAQKQIALNAEAAKDKMVINTAVQEAKKTAANQVKMEKKLVQKRLRKLSLPSTELNSEHVVESGFVQELQGADGALQRGEEAERHDYQGGKMLEQRIFGLAKRINALSLSQNRVS